MLGIVTRVWSNFYDVYEYSNKTVKKSQALGVFKHRKITIVPGDEVEVTNWGDKTPLILSVSPRTNYFYRPKIANVNQVFLVFSFVNPEINFYLLEKMVAYFEFQQINVFLILTKSDLVTPEISEKVIANFSDFDRNKILIINGLKQDSYQDSFTKVISEGIAILTGPSGAGKSTILNGLNSEFKRDTGLVGKKRGKHTTKEIALFQLTSGAFIADTPGFSKFDFYLEPRDLAKSFRAFAFFSKYCKYNNCVHQDEPECGVRNAVAKKLISKNRYLNYLLMKKELENGKN